MKIKRNVMINEKETVLLFTINEEAVNKAIKHNWDSLMFPTNNEEFVRIDCPELILQFELDTYGDTCIADYYDDKDKSLFDIYKRSQIKESEELMKAIETGEVYENDRWEVDSNNWFECCLYANKYNEWVLQSDEVFYGEPKNIDELVSLLEDYFVDMYKNLEKEEKVN